MSGSSPVSRSASRPGITCPPSSTSPRPISGSARCASGARSPDAPTLPWEGTTGWIPASRNASSRSTSSGRQPEWPSASVFARRSSIARTTSRGKRRAHAHRVADEQVLLELAGVGRRDVGGRQVAEPGRDPVDDLAGRDEALDDGARLVHPGPGVDVERATAPPRATASTSAIVRSAPVRMTTSGPARPTRGSGPSGDRVLGWMDRDGRGGCVIAASIVPPGAQFDSREAGPRRRGALVAGGLALPFRRLAYPPRNASPSSTRSSSRSWPRCTAPSATSASCWRWPSSRR